MDAVFPPILASFAFPFCLLAGVAGGVALNGGSGCEPNVRANDGFARGAGVVMDLGMLCIEKSSAGSASGGKAPCMSLTRWASRWAQACRMPLMSFSPASLICARVRRSSRRGWNTGHSDSMRSMVRKILCVKIICMAGLAIR